MKMNLGWVVVGAVGLFGCGDSTVAGITDRQVDAVNAAASKTCDSYDRCGEIGSDKSFTTSSECETDRKAFWNDRWPAADCDGHINGEKLQFCLDAIKVTSCDSFIDQLQTVYSKCAKSDVCS
jgi:hypothetical protein